MDMNTKIRNFHQAKWDEPVIFELSNPGERGIMVPLAEKEIENEIGDGISCIPQNMRRKNAPKLPELSQMQVLKHFLRLSQETLGADFNVDIGQGTCTMKYSPKINEQFAIDPKFINLHPLQNAETVQGMLQIVSKTEMFMKELSGLDRFTFQPGAGSHAILAMASMVSMYFRVKGEPQRDEIVTTMFSHPSDAAAAHVKGFKVVTLYSDENGYIDPEELRKVVSNRTAALFITNPEDTGVYNPRIKEFTNIVHEVGGLCCYDQANANGILGITRAKEANFDMCFFNLHKTFATPHGCGGPACGALGCTKELINFMPSPFVDFDGEKYFLNDNIEHSIGNVRAFYGTMAAVIRTYAWIMSLGEEGLKEISRIAVLNNNYCFEKIKKINGASAPFAKGKHRIEQVRYSWKDLKDETGIGTEDVTLRMCDFGMHLWNSHHPWIVPEPFTVEPTESYAKAELDEFIAVLENIAKEAHENPEIVKTAPHNSVIHKMTNTEIFDDPKKWAITWRTFCKKYPSK